MGAIGSAILVGGMELTCGTVCNALSSLWGICIGGGGATAIYAVCQPIGDVITKGVEFINRWCG